MEESSQAEPNIGTHSPFGIAVVDIAHEGLGLDFSVEPYAGRDDGGIWLGDLSVWPGEGEGRDVPRGNFNTIANPGFLVSPFNLVWRNPL